MVLGTGCGSLNTPRGHSVLIEKGRKVSAQTMPVLNTVWAESIELLMLLLVLLLLLLLLLLPLLLPLLLLLLLLLLASNSSINLFLFEKNPSKPKFLAFLLFCFQQ